MRHDKIKLMGILMLLIIVIAAGCSRKITEPVSTPINDFIPPTPEGILVTVGDRSISLSWAISDTSRIAHYNIYISDSLHGNYSLQAEPVNQTHSISGLHNGSIYFLRVSAVSDSGFEGYRSSPISVTPDVFSILINNGALYTNSLNLSLSLTAPAGTRLMQISNDSTFSGAQWEPFAIARNWQLQASDGNKSVFARFRDFSDYSTANNISDQIDLDTRSSIDSVIYEPVQGFFIAGNSIHFRLYAGELYGNASIIVGNNLLNLTLYDDGSMGDSIAGDGAYELIYLIPNNLDFENQVVFGNFTDRAGNTAPDAQASTLFSVRRHPDAVTINSLISPLRFYDRIEISWSQSLASDFASYRVYRKTSTGVDSSSTLIILAASTGTTAVVDSGLPANTQYFYKVYVVDNTGLWTGSLEGHATTNSNQPPLPVQLFPVVATPGRYDRLEMAWSTSTDQDFLRYELYRSLNSVVDSSDQLILVSNSQTSFLDTGLVANTEYYYSVLSFDFAGNFAWSNIRSGHTNADLPPEPITLMPISSLPDQYQNVSVSWTQSGDIDFSNYRLYRWVAGAPRSDSFMVSVISERATTNFEDHPPLNAGQDTISYWYIIHLYDLGGNHTASDSVRAMLIDLIPPQVSGNVSPSDSSLIITWSPTTIPDFASYRLLRNTTSNPATAITVFVASDSLTITYTDRNSIEGQTYYYWLDVYDRRDNSSRTLLGSANW